MQAVHRVAHQILVQSLVLHPGRGRHAAQEQAHLVQDRFSLANQRGDFLFSHSVEDSQLIIAHAFPFSSLDQPCGEEIFSGQHHAGKATIVLPSGIAGVDVTLLDQINEKGKQPVSIHTKPMEDLLAVLGKVLVGVLSDDER